MPHPLLGPHKLGWEASARAPLAHKNRSYRALGLRERGFSWLPHGADKPLMTGAGYTQAHGSLSLSLSLSRSLALSRHFGNEKTCCWGPSQKPRQGGRLVTVRDNRRCAGLILEYVGFFLFVLQAPCRFSELGSREVGSLRQSLPK